VDYWNHNSTYHRMIVTIAEKIDGDVLDVGCGEGLLVERLAQVSQFVTGVDRDERAIDQALVRTAGLTNATVVGADFMEFEAVPDSYDLITFVAALHHLGLESALRRSAQMLRPGGRLLVVGLSANKSVGDYIRSALLLPVVRLMSKIHHETRSAQVVAIPPEESFAEIRRTAREALPGVRLRRTLYYRYVLSWTKPKGQAHDLLWDTPTLPGEPVQRPAQRR
jgi:2-polyprenyl-3-methyl-5-hydroxy-6-metoxy-1,4-benzoquinol methylase